MNRAIDIGRPFGCWTYVRECHWGERSAVYMVAHVKDPGRVAALKICTDTDEESVRAFRREISNTRLRLLPGRVQQRLRCISAQALMQRIRQVAVHLLGQI